jgi:hypothetical protein
LKPPMKKNGDFKSPLPEVLSGAAIRRRKYDR